MRHVGERAKLALETINVFRLGARQCFQRHDSVHQLIVGLVHDTHAASAQATEQSQAFSADEFSCWLRQAEDL